MADDIVIRIIGDSSSFTRTVSQVDSAIKRVSGSTQAMGGHGVSSVQAISASLRVAQGDFTGLLRASERFIAQSQTLSAVAKGIFPAVGLIAIGSMFVRGAEEAAKFIEQVNKIPAAVREGYDSLNQSQRSANDALEVTNARLELETAKLRGVPGNPLALQLAEARKAADDLADALAKAAKEQADLLGKNENGVGAQLLGQGTTQFVYGNIQNFNKLIADTARQRQIALGNGDQKGADAALAQMHQYQQNALAYASENIQGRQKIQNLFSPKTPLGFFRFIPGEQSANINALTGFRDNIVLSQQNERDQNQHVSDDAANKKAAADKEAAAKQKEQQRQAQEAARQAAEAARQQQEQVIDGWRKSLDALGTVQALSLSQEADFWIDRATTARFGSKSYLTAVDEANKAISRQVGENARASTEFSTSSGRVSTPDLTVENRGDIEKRSTSDVDFLKSLNDGVNIQRQNATAYAEAALQIQVATGQMSSYDAAVAQAQLHTQEYTEQLNLLKDALAQVTGVDSDAQKRRSDINNQISQLNGQRAVDVLNDNAGINSQTLSGSFQTTMNEFIQQATDTAKQISEIFTQAVDSINSSLANSLLAKEPNGRAYRRNIEDSLGGSLRSTGSSILNDSFKQVEGGALKALGLPGGRKKPTGTAGDPIYTRQAGGATTSAASGISGLLGKLFGGGKSAAPDLSSIIGQGKTAADGLDIANDTSGLGDIASTPLQGFFASGGDVVAHRPAIIGERGPEMFVPTSAGRIIPNNQLNGLGGTSVTHNHFVDARGATDPAAVTAAVDRRMKAWAPSLTQASVKAGHEYNARRPSSMRK